MIDVTLLAMAAVFLIIGLFNGLKGEYSKGAFYMSLAAVEILIAGLK